MFLGVAGGLTTKAILMQQIRQQLLNMIFMNHLVTGINNSYCAKVFNPLSEFLTYYRQYYTVISAVD